MTTLQSFAAPHGHQSMSTAPVLKQKTSHNVYRLATVQQYAYPTVGSMHCPVWNHVLEISPNILMKRDDLKPKYARYLYNVSKADMKHHLVEINIGQICAGKGVATLALLSLITGMEILGAHEQGAHCARAYVWSDEVSGLFDFAKRPAQKCSCTLSPGATACDQQAAHFLPKDGGFASPHSIDGHIRCTPVGINVAHGFGAAHAALNELPRDRNCPGHTCDITIAHGGRERVNHRQDKRHQFQHQFSPSSPQRALVGQSATNPAPSSHVVTTTTTVAAAPYSSSDVTQQSAAPRVLKTWTHNPYSATTSIRVI